MSKTSQLHYQFQQIDSTNFVSKQNELDEIIRMQSLHAYRDDPTQNSFLITVWSLAEINEMILNGAVFYLMKGLDDALLGYSVITGLEELRSQLQGSGFCFNAENFGNPERCVYLYQFGVDPQFLKRGIGTLIFKHLLERYKGHSILSDYMISPKVNEVSKWMFEKNGFYSIGEMSLPAYRGFEVSNWQLVVIS